MTSGPESIISFSDLEHTGRVGTAAQQHCRINLVPCTGTDDADEVVSGRLRFGEGQRLTGTAETMRRMRMGFAIRLVERYICQVKCLCAVHQGHLPQRRKTKTQNN